MREVGIATQFSNSMGPNPATIMGRFFPGSEAIKLAPSRLSKLIKLRQLGGDSNGLR